MQRKHLIYLASSLLLLFPSVFTKVYAQEEEMAFHELEPEDDAFQDAFFAALRYKAIGNYNLALQALDKAEREAGANVEMQEVIGFERAQNHFYKSEYQEGILALETLLETNKRREVLDWLYLSYMEVRDFKGAKDAIVQLLDYSEVYLPNFYMLYMELTNQPKEAMQVLNQVFKTKNNTKQVGFYKGLISETLEVNNNATSERTSKSSDKEIEKLHGFLQEEDWEEARMYMELLLQKENNVLPVWQELEATKDLNQVYQNLETLFTKGNIPNKSKQSLLSAMLKETKDLEPLHNFIDKVYRNLDAASLKYVGNYFIEIEEKENAKRMYLTSLAISFDNYSLIVATLELLSETKDYNEQLELTKKAMDYYPMQPVLYLYKGEALIGLEQWSQAKDVLEEGASYIVDQPDLEKDFTDLLQKAQK